MVENPSSAPVVQEYAELIFTQLIDIRQRIACLHAFVTHIAQGPPVLPKYETIASHLIMAKLFIGQIFKEKSTATNCRVELPEMQEHRVVEQERALFALSPFTEFQSLMVFSKHIKVIVEAWEGYLESTESVSTRDAMAQGQVYAHLYTAHLLINDLLSTTAKQYGHA